MELYYINSDGEKLDFTKPPYVARDISTLLDYDWDCSTDGEKITGFSKEIAEIPLVINIFADTEEEYISACNTFFITTEKDVIKNVKGRLYYGSQFVQCNLIGSKKEDWCMGVNFNMNHIRLITDRTFWVTEETHQFFKSSSGKSSSDYLDYPYDFPYDYMGDVKGVGHLNNDHIAPCHFNMVIFGPCKNPRILVGERAYEVFTTVGEREYLVIESITKTVKRVRASGLVVNEFNSRRKQPSIFEKIPNGNNIVTWDGNFGHDITLFKERSEPEWRMRK